MSVEFDKWLDEHEEEILFMEVNDIAALAFGAGSAVLRAKLEATEASNDRMETALNEIRNWAKAYPLEVFPEPDFKVVAGVLDFAHISLDAVSASNMRHVLSGIEKIVDRGLPQ